MEELVTEINEKLNVQDAFTIPVLGGIHVTETVVIMWIIMAVMIIAAFLLTRNYTTRYKKCQVKFFTI